jgi:hypothetical protein
VARGIFGEVDGSQRVRSLLDRRLLNFADSISVLCIRKTAVPFEEGQMARLKF